jgi:hypothetical protein
MKVKELIEKLQQFDPEALVLTRKYSNLINMNEPAIIEVFKNQDFYSEFYACQFKHSKAECSFPFGHDGNNHDSFSDPPKVTKVIYFDGN